MRKTTSVMIVTSGLCLTCLTGILAEAQERSVHPDIENYFSLVNQDFSGLRALDTTSFVEKFWRIPGNKGFNESIFRVESILQDAGYIPEEQAKERDRLVYRIERRSMKRLTWEPIRANLTILGDDQPLLITDINRNIPLINSRSTPPGGVFAEVVHVGGARRSDFDDVEIEGKIVLGEASPRRLYREAVLHRGAIGILCYRIPSFNQPDQHVNSIPFGSIPQDAENQGWGLMLSKAAHDRLLSDLKNGPVRVHVEMETRLYASEELTLIAFVNGSEAPQEQFVFSAHVQEPGANDNASGVGCQAEMARVMAKLLTTGAIDPKRSITFLWGDEISSTHRYITEDPERAKRVKWGISLDMVGEDTTRTGGTFLIEKMPDPSAVWPRGDDHFSEWGGKPIDLARMMPHFFNDFILNRCLEQARTNGWTVRTNPFEGGSDHVPFLNAGKPSVLMWHFTDVYYHTDGDRIEMVSPDTLKNVGVSALVCALVLTSADPDIARYIIDEIEEAALLRLEKEFTLSCAALEDQGSWEREFLILRAWTDWYREAVGTVREIEIGETSVQITRAIERAAERIERTGSDYLARINSMRKQ